LGKDRQALGKYLVRQAKRRQKLAGSHVAYTWGQVKLQPALKFIALHLQITGRSDVQETGAAV
jgi:hypothetical protein